MGRNNSSSSSSSPLAAVIPTAVMQTAGMSTAAAATTEDHPAGKQDLLSKYMEKDDDDGYFDNIENELILKKMVGNSLNNSPIKKTRKNRKNSPTEIQLPLQNNSFLHGRHILPRSASLESEVSSNSDSRNLKSDKKSVSQRQHSLTNSGSGRAPLLAPSAAPLSLSSSSSSSSSSTSSRSSTLSLAPAPLDATSQPHLLPAPVFKKSFSPTKLFQRKDEILSSNRLKKKIRSKNDNDDNVFKKPLQTIVRPHSNNTDIFSGPITPQTPEFAQQAAPLSPPKSNNNAKQHLVSLTPAQRVEKKPGRLFNNSDNNSNNNSTNNGVDHGKSALDSYEFKELLGKGASASVFRALNLITGKEVAIKQIEITGQEDYHQLMSEIDLLKMLKHKNIVKYHGFVKTPQTLNIFLEYCSGGSLRNLYKRRNSGLDEVEVIRYTKDILQGLKYLHEQGVIHRDVKAANVLLAGDSTVKLADFGVSSKVNHHSSLEVGGTPYWMAPEVILLQGSSTASDIWSLGATVIELFTTHPPYHEYEPLAACHAIGIDDCPPIPVDLPELAKEFLLECFQRSPEIRINAARLLQHAWLNKQNVDGAKDILKTRTASASNILPGSAANNSKAKSLLPYREESLNTKNQWDFDFSNIVGEDLDRKLSSSQGNKLFKSKIITNKDATDIDMNVLQVPKLRPSAKIMSIKSKENLIGTLSPFKEVDNEMIKEDDFEGDLDLGNTNNRNMKIITTDKKNNGQVDNFALLKQFNEDNSNDFEKDFEQISLNLVKEQSQLKEISDDEDPFLDLKLEDSILKRNEAESKVILKVQNLIGKLDSNNNDLNEDISKLYKLLVENPSASNIIIKNHGLIRILELLNETNDYISVDVKHLLSLLNIIFNGNVSAMDSYCTIGGITSITNFIETKYPSDIRLEVVSFINNVTNSCKSLQMLVACGGLRLLNSLIEEDIEYFPEFPLCAINGIFAVFTNDLSTSNSNFCYILKNSVDWLAIDLNYLMKADSIIDREAYCDKIISIFQSFQSSEPRVKSYISTTTLFRSLFKNYEKLCFKNQLKILKFISSISSVQSSLDILDASGCLKFLITQLRTNAPPASKYKEVSNAVCPALFNLCHLNKIRQMEIVKLGGIPLLALLSKIDLPFKDFILPLLSEFVTLNQKTRDLFWENKVFDIFVSYLINLNWQVTSLDAIKNWLNYDGKRVETQILKRVELFIKGFFISNNLQFLEIFSQLLDKSYKITTNFCQKELIDATFTKFQFNKKTAVIQLNLLKILKKLISCKLNDKNGSDKNSENLLKEIKVKVKEILDDGSHEGAAKSSILVKELANEILLMF